MKVTTRRNIIVGTGLLGISAALGLAHPTLAAPRNNDVRQERRDVKEARREVKQERRDVRRADTPAERREERHDVKEARRDLKQEQRDVRRGTAPAYNNRPSYNTHPSNNHRPGFGDRPSYNPRPGYSGGNNNGSSFGNSHTGLVTRVRSHQSFDINIGGNIFNVYTVSRVPLGLSVGDLVRVNGVQQYTNDIRNAGVSIIRNG